MERHKKQGVILALAAYGLWAIAPIYFKWIKHIGAFEILAHRVLWSLLLTLIIILFTKRLPALVAALLSRKIRIYLFASTCLIGINWGIFIWAVNSNHLLSASLGYYINPLVNIFLGMIFFAERLGRVQKLAALLCIGAVSFEIWQFGKLPWIALILAVSFGLYGLVRKKLAVDSFVGMALETGLLLPLAVGYLLLSGTNSLTFDNASVLSLGQLFLAGPITMIPLLCFAAAANRISLTALGFFQYLGPTGMLLLAVYVYGEPLTPEKLTTFTIIWFALALLIGENLTTNVLPALKRRRQRKLSDSV